MTADRRALALVLVLAAVLVAACGSGPPTRAPSSTASTSTPTARACGTGARAFWLPAPSGSRLEANSAGSGPLAAVFLHEVGRLGMCGEWPYASWLATQGVQVVLVNRCGYGASVCSTPATGDAGIIAETQPAVDWARAHCASRVTLVGASGGGGDALQAAGVVSGVDAVVDISGDGNDTASDDGANARRVQIPALFAVARDDLYVDVTTFQSLYMLVPAATKRLTVIDGVGGLHGWGLLLGSAGQPTALGMTIEDWVRGRVG